MTSLDTSLSHTKKGAATIRRSSNKNPLEPLARMIEDDPTASFGLLFKKWKKIIERDGELLDAVLLYAFRNYHSLIERDNSEPQETTETREKRKEAIAKAVETARPYLLLEMKMPNGKKLGECTFREVSEFGTIFKLLSTKGKPSQKVGEVLTNDDLKKLLRAA